MSTPTATTASRAPPVQAITSHPAVASATPSSAIEISTPTNLEDETKAERKAAKEKQRQERRDRKDKARRRRTGQHTCLWGSCGVTLVCPDDMEEHLFSHIPRSQPKGTVRPCHWGKCKFVMGTNRRADLLLHVEGHYQYPQDSCVCGLMASSLREVQRHIPSCGMAKMVGLDFDLVKAYRRAGKRVSLLEDLVPARSRDAQAEAIVNACEAAISGLKAIVKEIEVAKATADEVAEAVPSVSSIEAPFPPSYPPSAPAIPGSPRLALPSATSPISAPGPFPEYPPASSSGSLSLPSPSSNTPPTLTTTPDNLNIPDHHRAVLASLGYNPSQCEPIPIGIVRQLVHQGYRAVTINSNILKLPGMTVQDMEADLSCYAIIDPFKSEQTFGVSPENQDRQEKGKSRAKRGRDSEEEEEDQNGKRRQLFSSSPVAWMRAAPGYGNLRRERLRDRGRSRAQQAESCAHVIFKEPGGGSIYRKRSREEYKGDSPEGENERAKRLRLA